MGRGNDPRVRRQVRGVAGGFRQAGRDTLQGVGDPGRGERLLARRLRLRRIRRADQADARADQGVQRPA